MKPISLLLGVFIQFFVVAQMEKKDLILGIDVGISNKFADEVSASKYWTADGGLPVGANFQYFITNKFSLGLHTNLSKVRAVAENRQVDAYTEIMVSSTGLYGVYHYVNSKHFMLGSGLSLGCRLARAPFNGETIVKSSFEYDVVLFDAKYIFQEQFGLQANLYLFEGYNTIANFGAFWRF